MASHSESGLQHAHTMASDPTSDNFTAGSTLHALPAYSVKRILASTFLPSRPTKPSCQMPLMPNWHNCHFLIWAADTNILLKFKMFAGWPASSSDEHGSGPSWGRAANRVQAEQCGGHQGARWRGRWHLLQIRSTSHHPMFWVWSIIPFSQDSFLSRFGWCPETVNNIQTIFK